MPELQVRKKSGMVEPFLRDKIYNGIVKSGGTPDQAEKITAAIEAWAPTVATEGIVNTSDIKVKLLEMLRVENPAAADQFESYKKEPAPEAPASPEPVVPVEPMSEQPAAPTQGPAPVPTEVEPTPAPTPVEPPAME